jgi:hypothetical protein
VPSSSSSGTTTVASLWKTRKDERERIAGGPTGS